MPALHLDQRRLAILKAMGMELWWVKPGAGGAAEKPAAADAGAAPDAQRAEGPVAVAGRVAAPVEKPAETSVEKPAETPVEKPVSAPEPAPARRVASASAAAPTTTSTSSESWHVALSPAVPWVRAAQAQAEIQTESETARSKVQWLLIVDDFDVLGRERDQAHKLLHNMLRAMGLAQSPALWISHARRQSGDAADPAPGQAQSPQGPQSAQSQAFADMLVQLQPAAVIALGRDAAQHVLGDARPLGVLRKHAHRVGVGVGMDAGMDAGVGEQGGVPVVVSYSPAYLLRASRAKAGAWEDLQRALNLPEIAKNSKSNIK